jgi:hypothetical protein
MLRPSHGEVGFLPAWTNLLSSVDPFLGTRPTPQVSEGSPRHGRARQPPNKCPNKRESSNNGEMVEQAQ